MEFNATFIITAISFVTFTFLMNAVLYRPLERIVEQRKNLISKNYSESDEAKNEAASILEKKAQTIAQAKFDAKSSIDNKVKDAYNASSEKLKEEKNKSLQYISEQKNALHSESGEVETNLGDNVHNLAKIIKDKLFGEI